MSNNSKNLIRGFYNGQQEREYTSSHSNVILHRTIDFGSNQHASDNSRQTQKANMVQSFSNNILRVSKAEHPKGGGGLVKNDKIVSNVKETNPNSSMGLESDTFASKKRKLVRIEFVKPSVNGEAEPFVFKKSLLPDNVCGQSLQHCEKNELSDVLHQRNQSIDDILNLKLRKTDKKLSDQMEDPCRSNSIINTTNDSIGESTLGVNTVNTAKDGIDESSNLNKVKLNSTPTNDSDSQCSSGVINTEGSPRQRSLSDSNSSFLQSHVQNPKRGHLSGVSVEDAVRDRAGLRPRSNSTDGELKLPQRGLCDERTVLETYKWKFNTNRVPKGFHNLGNTCFLNSTLQCLAYLPPFCQSMMAMHVDNVNKGSNVSVMSINGKRITQILRSLFHRVHGSSEKTSCTAISPSALVKAVPSLGSTGSRTGYKFRPGRQEDAHEFLVHLLDAMHDGELREAGINPHKSGWRERLPVPRLDETTFVHRIFGGYLRSQVRCTNCSYCSNTYDPFLDLSLEISRKSCTSVIDALKEFTRKETLDSENRWKCSGCKRRVCATKQLTVFRPPLSLCIQLKRFSFKNTKNFHGGYTAFSSMGGGMKITKPIEFPARLQLPLSDGRSCAYALNGIVIHVGSSASSGHYTACVKQGGIDRKDQWFRMDDSDADPISEANVLRQKDAYLLFYCREEVKLEFPVPPRKMSMSTEEALELSRAKALSRLERPLEHHEGQQTIGTNENETPSDASERDGMGRLKLEKHEDLPKVNHHSKSLMSEKINLPLSGESNTKTLVPSLSTDDNNHTDVGIDVRIDSSISNPCCGVDDREALEKVSSPLSTRKTVVLPNDDINSTRQLFGNNLNVHPVSDEKFNTSSATLSPKIISSSCKDLKLETYEENINGSEVNGTVKHSKLEPMTRVSVNRGGQKVEVMMGPQIRQKSDLWKPTTMVGSKEKGFDLLGNIPVTKWDEESCDSTTVKNTSGVDRSHLLDEQDRKEKARKRKMYLDRWDALLDQGKTKKVKNKKAAALFGTMQHPNQFQHIQSSLQHMNRGNPNGYIRPQKRIRNKNLRYKR